ncbi:MAG: pilus assembly protein PilM [Lachnospiraceae bacterium]|nr:pilus assembly protein PilM [Lachnospiraceae bacterium]
MKKATDKPENGIFKKTKNIILLPKKCTMGIDIGSESLRLAVVKGDSIVSAVTADLPDGVVVNGVIKAQDILGKCLKNAVKQLKISAKHVTLCLSGNNVIMREIVIPEMKEDKIIEGIRFEMPDVFNPAAEEYSVDYRILSDVYDRQSGERLMRMLVVCVPMNIVSDYMKVCTRAGIKVDRIDVLPNAHTKLIRKIIDDQRKNLVVDTPSVKDDKEDIEFLSRTAEKKIDRKKKNTVAPEKELSEKERTLRKVIEKTRRSADLQREARNEGKEISWYFGRRLNDLDQDLYTPVEEEPADEGSEEVLGEIPVDTFDSKLENFIAATEKDIREDLEVNRVIEDIEQERISLKIPVEKPVSHDDFEFIEPKQNEFRLERNERLDHNDIRDALDYVLPVTERHVELKPVNKPVFDFGDEEKNRVAASPAKRDEDIMDSFNFTLNGGPVVEPEGPAEVEAPEPEENHEIAGLAFTFEMPETAEKVDVSEEVKIPEEKEEETEKDHGSDDGTVNEAVIESILEAAAAANVNMGSDETVSESDSAEVRDVSFADFGFADGRRMNGDGNILDNVCLIDMDGRFANVTFIRKEQFAMYASVEYSDKEYDSIAAELDRYKEEVDPYGVDCVIIAGSFGRIATVKKFFSERSGVPVYMLSEVTDLKADPGFMKRHKGERLNFEEYIGAFSITLKEEWV